MNDYDSMYLGSYSNDYVHRYFVRLTRNGGHPILSTYIDIDTEYIPVWLCCTYTSKYE